jgi:hypothetical protein
MQVSMAKPQTANANVSPPDRWDGTHPGRRAPSAKAAAEPRYEEGKEKVCGIGGEGSYRRRWGGGLGVVEDGDWLGLREWWNGVEVLPARVLSDSHVEQEIGQEMIAERVHASCAIPCLDC